MRFRLDKYIAGLCFNRTAFHVQKSGLKSSVFRPKPFPQISPKSYRHSAVSNRFLFRFSTSRTNGPRSLSRVKVGTHSAFGKRSHTAAHTVKQGCFGRGWYHYPRSVPHVHKHPRAGYQNGVLCRFWVLVGDAPEERREPAEQRCAYARRCSEASRPRWAALLCLQLGDVTVLSLCAQYFLNVRGEGWYHYPRRALRAAETPDGRLSKRLVCRFLRSIGIAPCATPIFLRIYRYPCR